MADDDFDQFLPEFTALARRIFDAGVRCEHERLLALFQGKAPTASPSRPKRLQTESMASYGSISQPVRNALDMLRHRHPEGADTRAVTEYCREHDFLLTERQVRAALKQLYNIGVAIRVTRGHVSPD